ncbi:hypothetical protein MXB_5106 [Myxobolus squamalis]|nr:hypothetical protein MXB_5106 [Myxobolus squamalis]
MYSSQPYHIPSKRNIYGIIRALRGSMFANSIQAAQLPPLKHLPNENLFFRRFGPETLTANSTKCYYGLKMRHCHE